MTSLNFFLIKIHCSSKLVGTNFLRDHFLPKAILKLFSLRSFEEKRWRETWRDTKTCIYVFMMSTMTSAGSKSLEKNDFFLAAASEGFCWECREPLIDGFLSNLRLWWWSRVSSDRRGAGFKPFSLETFLREPYVFNICSVNQKVWRIIKTHSILV